MNLATMWDSIKTTVSILVGKVNWTTKRVIDPSKLDEVRALLKDNYYIILTRHNGHLSTYAIDLAHFILTFKLGHYGHVLFNVEDEVSTDDGYQFIEATSPGVHYSGFTQVFDQQVGSVCLMKPRSMSIEQWTAVVEKSKGDLGKPYDFALDPTQTTKLDCVELLRDALKGEPNYSVDFANLEALVTKYKELDPQMVYECPDFEVVWESR
jgi:hypothetical protein